MVLKWCWPPVKGSNEVEERNESGRSNGRSQDSTPNKTWKEPSIKYFIINLLKNTKHFYYQCFVPFTCPT